MPIALSTNHTCPVHLPIDAAIPEDQRPVFICRFLTAEQVDEIYRRRGEIVANTTATDAEVTAAMCDLLRPHVVGWRNMRDRDGAEIPFAADAGGPLSRVCTYNELLDLSLEIIRQTSLLELDKKKSPSSPTCDSPPPATAGDCATDAPAPDAA